MDCGIVVNDQHQLWDIKDGTTIAEIEGPDGKPFMDGLKRSDLRLAWSLSVNWFNPHGNKTSGKKKSVGSITMALLNLPPSLRYRTENIYLVGVIPGPKEPSLDEVNHFLCPLVDFFLPAWKDGTWFTKTMEHQEGRLSRSVIALAVNDLPGARKVGGHAAPTSHHMCNLCWLLKSDISNFNWESWRLRTYDEYFDAARCWRDTETKKEQSRLFKETGIRWSELLRLPYWDPTHFMVVDGMHNPFLGLVQFHFRDLIIIDKPANKEIHRFQKEPDEPLDAKELEKERVVLASKPTYAALNRLRARVLQGLVEEGGEFIGIDTRPTTKNMINVLLVSVTYTNKQYTNSQDPQSKPAQPAIPAQPTIPMEVDDEDLTVHEDAFIGEDIVEEYKNYENEVNIKRKAVEPLTNHKIHTI